MTYQIVKSLIAILFAGCSAATNIPVKWLPQVPPGDWKNSANCGPTSVLMIAKYYEGQTPTSTEIEQIDDEMLALFGYPVNSDNGSASGDNGSEPTGYDLATLASKYFDLPDSHRYANWTIAQLQEELANGYPVIVAVFTHMSPADGYNKHFMVLVGMDTNFVYVNDPGRTWQQTHPGPLAYTLSDFETAWQENANNAVVVIHPNGPLPTINNWIHTWGGSGSDSIASVTTDGSGNVYAVGSTSSFSAGGSDVLLLKYDSSGNLLWSRTWGGTGTENGNGVAVDSLGNVYIAGSTTSFGAGWYDALILKFDSSGNLLWSRTWGGGSFDVAYDLAFDTHGNLCIAAESYSLGNRAVVLRLDVNGNYLGAYTWKGPATYDSGYSVDVDTSGNIILAGTSWDYSVSPNHNSILLVKFDPNGNFLWHRNVVSGAEDEASGAKTVRFDGSGNIFVAGHRAAVCNSGNFSTCNFDADIFKFDPNGNSLWATSWGGTGFESLGGLAFDLSGNLVVSGGTNSFLNGTNAALLLKSDPNGNWLSSQIWNGSGLTGGSGVAVGPDGGVLSGGYAPNASGSWLTVAGSTNNPSLTVSTAFGNVGTSTFTLGACRK